MKRIAKILPVLALALVLTIGQVFAASGGSYSYTIKIYSGNQGTFADGSKVKEYTVAKGERFNFSLSDLKVKMKNDKYFAKGLKAVGDDYDKKNINQSLLTGPVTEDAEYVVAYGLKKDMVKYTVKYEDGSGKKLLKNGEYYGVVGDKPVVSYKYVEGYVPTAYNETKTLGENPERNVFVFYYEKTEKENKENGSSDKSSKNESQSGSSNSDSANAAPAGNGDQTVNQAQAIDNQNANANRDSNDNNADTDNNNNSQANENNDQPQELVDLDDNEVPLASGNKKKDNNGAGFMTAQTGVIAGAAALIAALLIFFIIRKRKRQAE